MPTPEALQNYPPEHSGRGIWLAMGVALGLHAGCFAGMWHWSSPLTRSAQTLSTVLTVALLPAPAIVQQQSAVAVRPARAAPSRVAHTARRAHAPMKPAHRQAAASATVAAPSAMAATDAATNVAAVAVPPVMETAPVYLTRRLPAYPSVARRRGLQGVVVVEVEVAADGAALSVKLQRSSGYTVLDSAALNAVRRWRFTPAQRAGLAVRAVLQVPIRFRLVGEQTADPDT